MPSYSIVPVARVMLVVEDIPQRAVFGGDIFC